MRNQIKIKKFFNNLIFNLKKIFFKINFKGKYFKLDICDECKKKFKNENIKLKNNKKIEKLFFFNSGYILHEKCLSNYLNKKNMQIICKVYKKNEIEEEINLYNFWESLNEKNKNNNNYKSNKKKEEEKNPREKYKNELFKKLRKIDNKYFNLNKF